MKDWRLKSWPSGITSRVTISIKQSKEDTKITIKQTGVPIKEVTFVLFPTFLHLIYFSGGLYQRRLAQILPPSDEAIVRIRSRLVLECLHFVVCEK